jgi:hypothetical protein
MMSEQGLLLPAEFTQTSTKRERRVWARQATNIDGICQPVAVETATEPETGWPGTIIDVSRGGIGLHLERRFLPGTLLIIELPSTEHEPARFLQVDVIRSTPHSDGGWIHGCKFLVELEEKDLQTLV